VQESPECHRGARDFIELWAVQVSKVLLEKLSEEGLEIPQAHVRLDVARDYMPYVIALEN